MDIMFKLKEIYTEQPGEHIFKSDAPYEKYPAIKLGLVFSMPILRLLQKTKLVFHPSLISLTGMILGLLAGLMFFLNNLIFGALFFYFAIVFDLVDGPYARLTNQYSLKTAKFDYFCDRIVKLICFFGIWYSQYFVLNEMLFGTILVIVYYSTEFYATMYLPNRFKIKHRFYFSVWEISFLIFIFAPLFNSVRVVLPLSIIVLIVMYVVMSIKKVGVKNVMAD